MNFHSKSVLFIKTLVAVFCLLLTESSKQKCQNKPTNAIIILADDLGYGDLGFQPFNSELMRAIKTPNLKQLSDRGLTLTNFHTASPICSPSRASIMLGLFPWRFGLDFIYAGDLKLDGSQEMDREQLPLIPNLAMSFRDAGYHTAHIGKWHLGGQSHIDIPHRFGNHCAVPGINQYGFDEYVGMSEGSHSMRYTTHQQQNTYHTGARYLFRNDVPLPRRPRDEILTDRQTEEAMRVIREQHELGRPFFLNLWFDAPHSPWEEIEPFFSQYEGKFQTPRLQKYASMITNLDMNIGRVIGLLESLNIIKDTIVFFTSDNGPETDAGSAGLFKGGKRLLAEGGIRVPAIVLWEGKLPRGKKSDVFMLTTDLFPTLLEACCIPAPEHLRIDGLSTLPLLRREEGTFTSTILKGKNNIKRGDERTVLWYTHSIGFPKLTAAWAHGLKLMWNDYEGRTGKKLPAPFRLFDMYADPLEEHDLLPSLLTQCEELSADKKKIDPCEIASKLNWNAFAKLRSSSSSSTKHKDLTNAMKQLYLQLLLHLQVKMHMFRHEGERDWVNYFKNRPYNDSAPSHCGIRSSFEVNTLPWGTSSSSFLLVPGFCGSNLSPFPVNDLRACQCVLSSPENASTSCVQFWAGGNLRPTLNLVNGNGNDLIFSAAWKSGSLCDEVSQILSITKYRPLCKVTTTTAGKTSTWASVLSSVQEFGKDVIFPSTTTTTSKNEWVEGPSANSHHRQYVLVTKPSHAQKNQSHRTHKYSLFASHILQPGCGKDAPYLVLNLRMLPHPLVICPDSLRKFQQGTGLGPQVDSKNGFIDDNFMYAAAHVITLRAVHPHADIETIGMTQFAVVDPLLFHSLLPRDDGNGQYPLFTDTALATALSMLSSLEPRLRKTDGQTITNHVLLPIYHRRTWSLAAICNLRSNNDSHIRIIYYHPMMPTKEKSKGKDKRDGIDYYIIPITRILKEITAFLGYDVHRIADKVTVVKRPQRLPHVKRDESGHEVLDFLQHFARVLQQERQISDFRISRLVEDCILRERKASSSDYVLTFLQETSKRFRESRAEYLKLMSANKF